MSKKRRDMLYRKLRDVTDEKAFRFWLPVGTVLRVKMATAEFFDHPLGGDGEYEMDMKQLMPQRGERLFPIELWVVDEQQSVLDEISLRHLRMEWGNSLETIINRLRGKMTFDEMCQATVAVLVESDEWKSLCKSMDAEFNRRTPESIKWTVPHMLAESKKRLELEAN